MDSSVESVAEVPSDKVDNAVEAVPLPLDKVYNAVDITGSLLGVTKRTLDEMYDLYRKHGCLLGFSVRKSTSRSSNGVTYEKYFVCSCSGLRQCKKDNSSVQTTKKGCSVRRTGCNATIRVKLNSSGLYEVVNHVLVHNHELTTERYHLHWSERYINPEKDLASESVIASGMRVNDMVSEAEEEGSVDHFMQDHLKMAAIEGEDAQNVLNMLNQQAEYEEDFFYRVKLDSQGRIQNLFWRDSMMKEDYKVYGDVVVFDTTYRTNKYNLICAPFFGVNNHRSNVMFACAFLSDEKMESFEWLFEVFKQSMSGQHPLTIFTDQDLTISRAIEKVFPSALHRLCWWHLYQNAIKRFGELKRNNSFKDTFNKFLTGCSNEDEFECCWNEMISKNGLEHNLWFNHLYGLREKWCTSLSKDFFSVGMASSQWGENSNFAVGFNASKYTSLTDFYIIFNETVKHWRSNEEHNEFQSSRSPPTSVLPMVGLLKHAAEVYTQTTFKDFENEFMRCISAHSSVESVENTLAYNVIDDKECSHRVEFDASNNMVNCSCKKMEVCGLLCSHCLRVFHVNSIDKIPQHCIAKRWTRFAKSDIWDTLGEGDKGFDNPKDVLWRHEMAYKFYTLVVKCQSSPEARKIIEDGYNRALMAVSNMVSSPYLVEQSESNVISPSPLNAVFDPSRSVKKRRRQMN